MRFIGTVQIMCAALFLPLTSLDVPAGDGELARHTGNIQSVRPSDGMLIIEELGTGGVPEVLEVGTRKATVVRIWRDSGDPWTGASG